MPATSVLHWYVVYTKPRSEKKLTESLNKLGISNYLPLLRKRKKWSDRHKWIEEPIFTSYVFVQIEFERQSLNVLKIPQAVSFVMTGSQPAIISDTDLEILRISLENFAESLSVKDTSQLIEGLKVRIHEGPFAGRDAVIERIHGKTLVLVAFPALSKSVQVEISVQQIGRSAIS